MDARDQAQSIIHSTIRYGYQHGVRRVRKAIEDARIAGLLEAANIVDEYDAVNDIADAIRELAERR